MGQASDRQLHRPCILQGTGHVFYFFFLKNFVPGVVLSPFQHLQHLISTARLTLTRYRRCATWVPFSAWLFEPSVDAAAGSKITEFEFSRILRISQNTFSFDQFLTSEELSVCEVPSIQRFATLHRLTSKVWPETWRSS